jgi:DNA-binding CsgD family transcriptional regulator
MALGTGQASSTDSTSPVGDAVALLRFTRALVEASNYAHLERAFADGFGRTVDVPMCGFYALDAEGTRIAHNVAVNVSDVFVARYERSMEHDPLLVAARATGRPVYNRGLMSAQEWEESDAYRLAYATHRMRHVAEVPVSAHGRLVGALHFAASEPTRGFAATDFQLVEAIAGVLGVAIARIQADGRAERAMDRARAALELAGVAVVVSSPGAVELERNDAARGLLDTIADGEAHLHALLSRSTAHGPSSRRAEIALVSGEPGVLHAHCARLEDGELVAVLELQRDHEGLAVDPRQMLTPRESEVAALVVEGLTDREIADRLFLSHYTVGQHLKRVYRKLGVTSRVGLTRLLTGRRVP